MKFEGSIYFLATSILFGCSNSGDDATQPTPRAKVTYDANVKNIIVSNCIACHGNPPTSEAPMSLTNYLEVKNAVENRGLIDRINSITNPMPPKGGLLPKELRDVIQQWRDDGLLEK